MEGCHCWQQRGMKDGGVPLLATERHEGWRGATVGKRGMKDGGVPLLAAERHEGWRGATVGSREA